MNTRKKPRTLTFGALIESGYRACGKSRAQAVIRLAAKTRLLVFQGRGRLIVFPRET